MSNFGPDTGLTKDPGAKYVVDQMGFATYDKSYSGILIGACPFQQGDFAVEYANVILLSYEMVETGIACNHMQIKLHYEGKDPDTSYIVSQNISVDFTTSQEPIESNPEFVTGIGGTPTAPLHGAFFDKTTGEFVGFPVVDPDEPLVLPSRFAGLRSYLMPQETAVSNSVEYEYPTAPEIATIGRVVVPGVNLPALPGERNWLNTGIRVTNIANFVFKTQKTFMLSGPRKWVPEVYGV